MRKKTMVLASFALAGIFLGTRIAVAEVCTFDWTTSELIGTTTCGAEVTPFQIESGSGIYATSCLDGSGTDGYVNFPLFSYTNYPGPGWVYMDAYAYAITVDSTENLWAINYPSGIWQWSGTAGTAGTFSLFSSESPAGNPWISVAVGVPQSFYNIWAIDSSYNLYVYSGTSTPGSGSFIKPRAQMPTSTASIVAVSGIQQNCMKDSIWEPWILDGAGNLYLYSVGDAVPCTEGSFTKVESGQTSTFHAITNGVAEDLAGDTFVWSGPSQFTALVADPLPGVGTQIGDDYVSQTIWGVNGSQNQVIEVLQQNCSD